jgi:hypothetical protein
MSMYFAIGSETTELSQDDLKQSLCQAFQALGERQIGRASCRERV